MGGGKYYPNLRDVIYVDPLIILNTTALRGNKKIRDTLGGRGQQSGTSAFYALINSDFNAL